MSAAIEQNRTCDSCGGSTEHRRSFARFCSKYCSNRAYIATHPEKKKEYWRRDYQKNADAYKARAKAYAAEHGHRKKPVPKASKDCERCDIGFAANRSDQRFCSASCQAKSWAFENTDRIREHWKSAYWRNTEVKKARSSAYGKAHPEVRRRACKKYSQTEHGKQSNVQKARRRRARKMGADGQHTRSDFLYLVETYQNRCLACLEIFPTSKLTEDHVVPLSRGGSDWIENIQPLCLPCNARKFNHTADYRPQEISA